MLEIYYTKKFLKELKLAKKRGKDITKIEIIMDKLANSICLDRIHCDHILVGDFVNRRECHIESDWL